MMKPKIEGADIGAGIKLKIPGFLLLFIFFLIFTLPVTGQTGKPEDLVKKVSDDVYLLNKIEINTKDRSVSIPCLINMTSGLLEVVVCRPEGKDHESLLITDITPLEFNTALLLLGLDPVNEIPDDPAKADPLSTYKTIVTPGDSVVMFIEYEKDGRVLREPCEKFIRDERTKKALTHRTWIFSGAVTHISGHVLVDDQVTMIATYHDPVALMELNSPDVDNDELFYVNEDIGMAKDQEVKLIIQALKK